MIGILIAAIVVLYAIIIILGVSVFILFKHIDREKKVKDGFESEFKVHIPIHARAGYDVDEIHRAMRRNKV